GAEGLRRAMEEANGRGVSRLVLALRGTIGGDLAAAVTRASLFVGKGLVARGVSRRVTLPALEATGERLWKGRTVVLIDDATGGAAEAFPAPLHDRGEGG